MFGNYEPQSDVVKALAALVDELVTHPLDAQGNTMLDLAPQQLPFPLSAAAPALITFAERKYSEELRHMDANPEGTARTFRSAIVAAAIALNITAEEISEAMQRRAA